MRSQIDEWAAIPVNDEGSLIFSSGVEAPARRERPSAMLCIDVPRIVNGAADTPVQGGLSVVGWGLCIGGVESIDIALDGARVGSARHGLRRPDVAAAHGDWPEALLSGFAVHLPPKALPVGPHRITLTMRNPGGEIARAEFAIEVVAMPVHTGPTALRRKMSQAEVDHKRGILASCQWRPSFRILLNLPTLERRGDATHAAVTRTLRSLTSQTYPDWEVWLLGPPKSLDEKKARGKHAKAQRVNGEESAALLRQLTAEFEEVAPRIRVVSAQADRSRDPARSSAAKEACFILCPAVGDEFGCDALIEFAIASAIDRDAEFIFSDERLPNPIDGRSDAYFKPGWSPDLLLATNYIGRAWCASLRSIERAGLTMAELFASGEYDLTLRLTEAAEGIIHVPKLLTQQGTAKRMSDTLERQALRMALERREISAQVRPGLVRGQHRVQRTGKKARVSIIIPTCGAGGFIKRCLQSLKRHTAYRDYEIVCIENIPPADRSLMRWLKSAADIVIETTEPFNWSRYNNLAASKSSGTYVLFLNDDTEIVDPGWLDALVDEARRPEVGVVGALLQYPDSSVQQAGVMLDPAGRGLHAFRHLPAGDPGYFGLALTPRNVLSVTGACLMTRRDTFDELGGFDESHAIINNDLDYCLRAWKGGLLNVYTPHARLIHHEMGSRAHVPEAYDVDQFQERWRAVIARGDPYVNPNLAADQEQFAIESEPVETVFPGALFSRESVRRILVLKLDHLGDCITALPALRRLDGYFPAARITVLAGRSSQSLWRSEASVDDTLEFNFFHARSGLGKVPVTDDVRQALTDTLHGERFDLAIDLRKQPDTRDILQLTGARLLAGFDHQGRFPWLDVALEWDEDVPLRSKHGHVSDDLIALVDAVSMRGEAGRGATLSCPKGALVLGKAEQRRLFEKPLICLHPASGSPMRQWPLESFAALAQLLLEAHDCHIALIGGADERELLAPLLQSLGGNPRVFDLVGRLDFEDLPRLLARAALFVGNNSGPQHLASSLGIPTIGIHSGVVDATEWGPMGPKARAVRRAMSCSPCFLEYPKDCQRGIACLTELAVRDVYRECLRALPMPRTPRAVTHA